MRSAKPAGRASGDQDRNLGLRTSAPPRLSSQLATRYGPVPGGGWLRVERIGVPAGMTNANGIVSLWRKSPSGRLRWTVIVRAARSVAMPRERSQRPASHRRAPTMPS